MDRWINGDGWMNINGWLEFAEVYILLSVS